MWPYIWATTLDLRCQAFYTRKFLTCRPVRWSVGGQRDIVGRNSPWWEERSCAWKLERNSRLTCCSNQWWDLWRTCNSVCNCCPGDDWATAGWGGCNKTITYWSLIIHFSRHILHPITWATWGSWANGSNNRASEGQIQFTVRKGDCGLSHTTGGGFSAYSRHAPSWDYSHNSASPLLGGVQMRLSYG